MTRAGGDRCREVANDAARYAAQAMTAWDEVRLNCVRAEQAAARKRVDSLREGLAEIRKTIDAAEAIPESKMRRSAIDAAENAFADAKAALDRGADDGALVNAAAESASRLKQAVADAVISSQRTRDALDACEALVRTAEATRRRVVAANAALAPAARRSRVAREALEEADLAAEALAKVLADARFRVSNVDRADGGEERVTADAEAARAFCDDALPAACARADELFRAAADLAAIQAATDDAETAIADARSHARAARLVEQPVEDPLGEGEGCLWDVEEAPTAEDEAVAKHIEAAVAAKRDFDCALAAAARHESKRLAATNAATKQSRPSGKRSSSRGAPPACCS